MKTKIAFAAGGLAAAALTTLFAVHSQVPDGAGIYEEWCSGGICQGVTTFGNTDLHIEDTNASHDLIIKPGTDLSADRTFTLTTGDANRSLTVSADSTINQDVSTTGTPTHYGVTYTAPTTSTVTANAATCNFASYDVCVVDMQGSTGNVTLTLSNGRFTGNLIKIIQGDGADDIVFSPTLHSAGGTALSAVTTTEDAIDLVFLFYDGSNYLFTSQLQDVKVIP